MKRIVFILVFIFVLCFNMAYAAGSYGFSDACEDAETVRAYFNSTGSETEAAASFYRLYDFWYQNAKPYVLNKNKMKFHNPDCLGVNQMKEANKIFITCSRDLLVSIGYEPCGTCHP